MDKIMIRLLIEIANLIKTINFPSNNGHNPCFVQAGEAGDRSGRKHCIYWSQGPPGRSCSPTSSLMDQQSL